MSYMDELMDLDEAVREVAPEFVGRYRSSGVLTWALLHRIESEIVDALAASGHSRVALNMIRSARVMNYPRDDSPASFKGSELMPIVFSEIERAWNLVH